MKLKSVSIENVGGISNLMLKNLHGQMNIICGENGVGKTNILDSIAYIFSHTDMNIVNKKVGSRTGRVVLNLDTIDYEVSASVIDYEPKPYSRNYEPIDGVDCASILYLKVNRVFQYKFQEAIGFSDEYNSYIPEHTAGLKNKNLKSWFIYRSLFSLTEAGLTQSELDNINKAKELFSILDESFSFSHVTKANEIVVKTPTGEIYFEYLSSGFKSIFYILLGILKELDFRFFEKDVSYKNFDGIILIDEIELHLHPEWQGRICNILKSTFPCAQFILSTHSPHVIQSAEPNEVIALERIDDNVVKRDSPESSSGYQGWTIEEVLRDVMGLSDLRSNTYEKTRERFKFAFKEKRKKDAQKAFADLDNMLHPTSELRAIYRMQLDSLED